MYVPSTPSLSSRGITAIVNGDKQSEINVALPLNLRSGETITEGTTEWRLKCVAEMLGRLPKVAATANATEVQILSTIRSALEAYFTQIALW